MEREIQNLLLEKIDDNQREYQICILKNGMKCVLIHNPCIDTSACCILNPCGSLYDPKEYQGLTHFLEHLLFLGSEKYPDPNHYRRFVGDNGGRCNAWTFRSFTKYHFELPTDKFIEGLDILTNQLSHPTLLIDSGRIEIWAVDSEHHVNINNNVNLYSSVSRELGDPESTFSKYPTGDIHSLNVLKDEYKKNAGKQGLTFNSQKLRDEALDENNFEKLMKETKKHFLSTFSADHMIAVIESGFSSRKIKKIAERYLGKMPVRKTKLIDFSKDPGPLKNYGKLVNFRPCTAWDFVSFQHYLPPVSTLKTKPLLFLEYIIGQKRRGSLYDSLKRQNLIKDLYLFWDNYQEFYSKIEIRAISTYNGIRNYEKIIRACAAFFFWLKAQILQGGSEIRRVYCNWVKEKKIRTVGTKLGSGLEFVDRLSRNVFFYGLGDPGLIYRHKLPKFSTGKEEFLDCMFEISEEMIEEGLGEVLELLSYIDGEKAVVFRCSQILQLDNPNSSIIIN